MEACNRETIEPDRLRAVQDYARKNGAGIIASTLLHAAAIILVLFVLSKARLTPSQSTPPFVAVQIVRLGEETTAPAAVRKSAIPQQRLAHIPVPHSTSPRPPVGVAPEKKPVPVDALEAKLRGLARLRQPDAALHAPDTAQAGDTDSTSDEGVPGNEAVQSLRDFIRAQVLRRWSLDLTTLGSRKLTIAIRVEITRNGTVTETDIVDKQRFATDRVYHDIARSARNAILLSSPFALPPGSYEDVMRMTLVLNPREALR